MAHDLEPSDADSLPAGQPDRRGEGVDRRSNVLDRRSGLERRRGPGRRRPESRRLAEEGELSDEQFEFVMAVDEYKRLNRRPFPTWTEVLEVIKYLGYRKVAAKGEHLDRLVPHASDDASGHPKHAGRSDESND